MYYVLAYVQRLGMPSFLLSISCTCEVFVFFSNSNREMVHRFQRCTNPHSVTAKNPRASRRVYTLRSSTVFPTMWEGVVAAVPRSDTVIFLLLPNSQKAVWGPTSTYTTFVLRLRTREPFRIVSQSCLHHQRKDRRSVRFIRWLQFYASTIHSLVAFNQMVQCGQDLIAWTPIDAISKKSCSQLIILQKCQDSILCCLFLSHFSLVVDFFERFYVSKTTLAIF